MDVTARHLRRAFASRFRTSGYLKMKVPSSTRGPRVRTSRRCIEAVVLVTVHANGSTGDLSLYRSSGSRWLDDAGMTAAKATTISPARLPPQLGGTLIDAKYLIDYTGKLGY
jgi:TonB family protein